MHKARKNINFNKLQSVLRRFHNTPLDLYSYFISNGRMDLLRRSKVLRTSVVVAVFMLVLLTSAVLVPLYNKLEVTEAATGTAVSSKLTMNLTNSTALVDLSVNKANGAFGSSTSPIAFNISTTNVSGYTLSIKNSKSTTTLVNSTNSSYTLSSLTGTVTPTNFSADSTTAATNYNGKWGYYPNKYNSSTNSYYRPSPTTAASTLDKTSSANTSGTVNSYTIGIGARASYTTPAGEYTGTYILTAVGNTVSYSITFNKGNTSDTVSNLPSTQSSSGTSSTSITLSSTKPTRTGYTFTGWCMGTISTNTSTHVDSCTGTNSKTFSAGSSFGIDQTTSNITTLYAMWTRNNVTYTLNYNANNGTEVPNSQSNTNNHGSYTFTLNTTTIPTRSGYNFLGYATTSSATTPAYTYTAGTGTNGANGTFSPSTITLTQSSMSSAAESTTLYAVWEELTYMQGLSSDKCTTTASKVVDSRDGTTYTIQRLADGNCWLLDNLALDLTNSTVLSGMSATNTNATNTALGYLKGTTTGTASDQWATSKVATAGDTDSYSDPRMAKSGTCLNSLCVNEDLTWDYLDVTPEKVSNYTSYVQGKVGIYYNFCTTSAGSFCYGNDEDYGSSSSTTTLYDICPNGWRLPTGDSKGEFKALHGSYDGIATNTKLFIEALHISLTGSFNSGKAADQGFRSYYWSSTYDTEDDEGSYAYALATQYHTTFPTISQNRDRLFSIRCLLKEPSNTRSISVTFAGSGVSSVQVRTGAGASGGTLIGTISTSGGSVAGLTRGTTYYLYPTFSSGYELDNWALTSSEGTLSSTSDTNPTITLSATDSALTLTGKASYDGYYIHNFTLANCSSLASSANYTVRDIRDKNDYTVRYINGRCWMTQNLRFTGTYLNSAYTNVTSSKTMTYYDLSDSANATEGGPCWMTLEAGLGHENACIKDSGNTTYGAYYNYPAASAGTVTKSLGVNPAVKQDICPKNWHIPTGPGTVSNTDFNKLVGNTTASQEATTGLTAFGAVSGGYYSNGSKVSTGYGYYWSSTAATGSAMYALEYRSSGRWYTSNNGDWLPEGNYVRCVRSS